MSATAGMVGKGTTLSHSSDGTTYTVLAELVSIERPKITMDMADFTNYTSLNSTIEKLPSGWLEIGDLKFTVTYSNASETILRGLIGTSLHYWKITYPDTHTDVFQGTLRELGGGEVPNKEKITTECLITPQTKPTFA